MEGPRAHRFQLRRFSTRRGHQLGERVLHQADVPNKIRRADTFVLLIGSDTYTKTTFVKWEVGVAIEKGCRLIGVNITNCRFKDSLCPYFFADKGAVFVPFSSRIVAEAMKHHCFDLLPGQARDFYFYDHIYAGLGYQLIGDTAVLPLPPNPFQFGRPPWAR
jgi:hypothetical protein